MQITFNHFTVSLKLLGKCVIPFIVYSFQVHAAQEIQPNKNTYFNTVKSTVFSDSYDELPHYKVRRQNFDEGKRNILLEDALRTMQSNADLIEFEAKQKLLQANGICFSGTWIINSISPYTGLYEKNTQADVLTRVSVSLSGTTQKDKRAMGMAIKVFTQSDSNEMPKTLNAFVMHSLGGIKTQYVLDLTMDNEPELGALPPFNKLLTAYRLEKDLEKADRKYSGDLANARFRPVDQLAKIDVTGEQVSDSSSPYWLRVSTASNTPRVDKKDFRDELEVSNYPEHTLTWDIYGADYQPSGKEDAVWRPLGQLVMNESIRSKSCDTRLHFHHPSIQPSS